MLKRFAVIVFIFSCFMANSQEVLLPGDFRQHNITEYNSSFLSPIYSLDRNNPESVAWWSRWQWQSPDFDPTTLFLNYSRRLSNESAAGAAFFQHNTGVFLQTGLGLNYAYALDLESNAQIAFGVNLFGFQQKLADDRFIMDPDMELPIGGESNSFVIQLAPSLRFKIDRFDIGIVAENLFDYNFTNSERETSPRDKVYIGLASYKFPVTIFDSSDASYIRPTIYLKTIPNFDNQVGFSTLFSTPKFWAQAGYNSFYGISGGLGGRFKDKLSIGALIEFGTSSDLDGLDPSFEFVTAYFLGEQESRSKVVGFDVNEEFEIPDDLKEFLEEDQRLKDELDAEAALALEADQLKKGQEETDRITQDSIARAAEAAAIVLLAEKQKRTRDSISADEREKELALANVEEAQRKQDSITRVKEAEALAVIAAKQQQTRDSIAAIEKERALAEAQKQAETDKPKEGEKYQEVVTAEGLQPGFYLIANVFGTQKYYEIFMRELTNKGFQPKSFYRSINKYNYVYLKRYDSMEAARRARDSKYNGRYQEDLWIFRVVGD